MGPYKGLKEVRRIVIDCMKNIHRIYRIKVEGFNDFSWRVAEYVFEGAGDQTGARKIQSLPMSPGTDSYQSSVGDTSRHPRRPLGRTRNWQRITKPEGRRVGPRQYSQG